MLLSRVASAEVLRLRTTLQAQHCCWNGIARYLLSQHQSRHYSKSVSPQHNSKNRSFKGMDILGPDALAETAQPKTSILAYGDRSFQINDTLVRQSVILMPTKFLLWNARRFEDITVDSLSMFSVLSPTLEVLFIGCGERVPSMLPREISEHFRERGIVVEATSTMNAASTFNLLNGEGRNVGAALLTLEPVDPIDMELLGSFKQ